MQTAHEMARDDIAKLETELSLAKDVTAIAHARENLRRAIDRYSTLNGLNKSLHQEAEEEALAKARTKFEASKVEFERMKGAVDEQRDAIVESLRGFVRAYLRGRDLQQRAEVMIATLCAQAQDAQTQLPRYVLDLEVGLRGRVQTVLAEEQAQRGDPKRLMDLLVALEVERV